MKVFKVTYLNNDPISCNAAVGKVIKGDYAFEYNRGSLIHAFVYAKDEEEALKISRAISADFLKQRKLRG
jgi:hypothetical protein